MVFLGSREDHLVATSQLQPGNLGSGRRFQPIPQTTITQWQSSSSI